MTNLDIILSESTFRNTKCEYASKIIEGMNVVKLKMIEAGVFKANFSLDTNNIVLCLHSSDDSLRIYGKERTLFVEGTDILYSSLENKKFLLSILNHLLGESDNSIPIRHTPEGAYSIYWNGGHLKTFTTKREAIDAAKHESENHNVRFYGAARFDVVDEKGNIIETYPSR